MKTKSVLLIALFASAWIASARAQVYSVNAVGYINVSLTPGFNLIANPLRNSDNSISNLFINMSGGTPGIPAGTKIYKMVNGAYITVLWDDLEEKFVPEANAAQLCLPGDGVFVFLGGNERKTLTFVGEVPQGDVCTHVPRGWSIKGNPIPTWLDFNRLNFPGGSGDRIFRFNKVTGSFQVYQFEELENQWPMFSPMIGVGEAFIVYRNGPSVDWCQRFFVNNPN